MGNKNRRERQLSRHEMYWQSPSYTNRMFMAYQREIIALATNRYKWHNLPDGVSERVLELELALGGSVSIAFPRKIPGGFFATRYMSNSQPNINGDIVSWVCIGANGSQFAADRKSGVIVYDNRERIPLGNRINLWARELTDITRTMQVNRFHLKTPYILVCPKSMENQALNVVKQMAGYEPAIIATEGFEQFQPVTLQTGVQFLGTELSEAEQNAWNRVYNGLGIPNLTFKGERMIEDEVKSHTEPTNLIALDGLTCRNDACAFLNDRFGGFLDSEIFVTWNADNLTDNYNLANNAAKLFKAGDLL